MDDRLTEFIFECMEEARQYAYKLHEAKGCAYDGMSYSVHLDMVVAYVREFADEIVQNRAGHIADLIMAGYLHDALEDCGITYNDLVQHSSSRVADIVYSVTNELGKNRKERALRTYPKIAADEDATYVKCCDRLANTAYSRRGAGNGDDVDTRMFGVYTKEYSDFRAALYKPGAHPRLWARLDEVNEFVVA